MIAQPNISTLSAKKCLPLVLTTTPCKPVSAPSTIRTRSPSRNGVSVKWISLFAFVIKKIKACICVSGIRAGTDLPGSHTQKRAALNRRASIRSSSVAYTNINCGVSTRSFTTRRSCHTRSSLRTGTKHSTPIFSSFSLVFSS